MSNAAADRRAIAYRALRAQPVRARARAPRKPAAVFPFAGRPGPSLLYHREFSLFERDLDLSRLNLGNGSRLSLKRACAKWNKMNVDFVFLMFDAEGMPEFDFLRFM